MSDAGLAHMHLVSQLVVVLSRVHKLLRQVSCLGLEAPHEPTLVLERRNQRSRAVAEILKSKSRSLFAI
jgi:hypothetical protein